MTDNVETTAATTEAAPAQPAAPAETQAPAQPSNADAPAADAAATPSKQEDAKQLMFETAEGDKPEGEVDKADAKEKKEGEEGEEKEGDKDDAESVEYEDFVVPEEFEIPEESLSKFKEFGAKHNLTQEAAQELLDMHFTAQKDMLDAGQNLFKEWREETEKDETYGGKHLKQSLSNANEVARKYGDEQFLEDIQLVGFGNKLSFMKFLNKVHQATKNDTIADSESNSPDEKMPVPNILWKDMK